MTDVTSQLNSLVDHLKRHIFEPWSDGQGVTVKYHTEKPLIHFHFRTTDSIGVGIDYEINKTSQEYIGNMVMSIRDKILATRQDRHNNPLIINTGASNA